MPARRALLARAVPLLAIPAILASATPAYAHGIGDEAADKSVLEFVPVGITHMLLGWDHLLFVAGVLLVAAQPRLAAKLISLFVLGHSTTLIAATLSGWRVSPETVDVVIALSVVFVACVGMLGRPKNFRWFAAAVLGFGLIHGLGLATRFQDLGIPEGGELWRVIAFNIGIEIGQLAAIAIIAGLLYLATRFIAADKHARATQLACAPMFIGCSVAASLIALNAFTALPDTDTTVDLAADSTCEITSPTKPWTYTGGDHPEKDFYGPGETAPMADFAHVIGDGYVIVMYADGIPAQHVDWLRDYVDSPEGRGVMAAPSADTDGIAAYQYRETMTCQTFESDSLDNFSQQWLKQVRG
ncbi:HupE/UreJ family protein [Nocardioides sp.]|uniref:HupE/UreJ family protein n=1 Tax=Nocardioides sp. TaxID=35761 RepID=UPI0027356042|nr:HupE/UreJ family protein [Nocardioides sp.]MDP3893598.1 HupE/UreJ family protein [Nocardioides sp.]